MQQSSKNFTIKPVNSTYINNYKLGGFKDLVIESLVSGEPINEREAKRRYKNNQRSAFEDNEQVDENDDGGNLDHLIKGNFGQVDKDHIYA